jgi:NifB/MoaA-like Fe-S oxidoreductase
MVPEFLHRAERFRKLKHVPVKTPVSVFTGTSFYPYLAQFSRKLNKKTGMDLRVVPVENLFFGTTVTVTGLLTGRDIIRAFMGHTRPDEVILIPDVTLRDGQNVFLDDVTTDFIGEALGVKTKIIESSFEGLIKAIEELD